MDGDWTGGFWVGMLWLAAHMTGEDRYGRAASEWSERLRPRSASDTVFWGLLFWYGAALSALLCAEPAARGIALDRARGLATSYNDAARVLPLGSEAEEAAGRQIAYWDFDDPRIPNANLDTSATAIAASSLLKLGAIFPERETL
jgi:hypothetical protein